MLSWHPAPVACSAATSFSAKITRFTKKFTRSEKKSLDFKILASKLAVLREMV